MSELVHFEVADAVATITLDSEHNRNALSRQLVAELLAHLESADADESVRAVLLRSAGRVFCSGADLSEAAEGSAKDTPMSMVGLLRRIATLGKPVVIELGGPVRAGGVGIVGAADVVVAAESVTFALTEVRLGLAPAVISLSLLERLAPREASDVFLTGRTFGADEAARMGLVTHALPDDRLATGVQDVLDDLVKGYPQGLRETKAIVNHDLVARIDALGEEMSTLSARLFGSDEAREAMLAFLASRKK